MRKDRIEKLEKEMNSRINPPVFVVHDEQGGKKYYIAGSDGPQEISEQQAGGKRISINVRENGFWKL